MDVLPVIIMVGVGAVVIFVSSYVQNRPQRRRRDALQRLAPQIGFQFEGDIDPFKEEPGFDYRKMGLLSRSEWALHSRNVLRGRSTLGTAFLFDLWYHLAGGGRDNKRVRQTIAAFHLPGETMPEFSVRPEGAMDKVGSAIFSAYTERFARDQRDLDFSSHPDFSARYTVRGPDEGAIRQHFQPALLQSWESLDRREQWVAEGAGEWLIVYQDRRQRGGGPGQNKEIPIDQMAAFRDQAEEIARAFSEQNSR